MADLVSRNTVILGSGASSVDDYYKNYLITLYKYDSVTDKQSTQVNRIISYSGSSKTATIDGLWNIDAYPVAGDKIVITPPYSDIRSTINPAIQTMDYVTSPTYGRGLDPVRDLNLPSWLESGRNCDTQSDVTVQTTGGYIPPVGAKYRWPVSGQLIWQGTVVGSDSGYTQFTNVIGKLSNNWNNWKNYAVNELVYSETRLYQVTSAGVKNTQPTHTSGTTNGLQFLGTGPTLTSSSGSNLTLVYDGNPVRSTKDGAQISGYSLYDCDEVDYYRYLGWDEFSQRYVTKHQTNLTVDSSLPLFDNTNSFLEHFGGMMRYTSGRYYLDMEAPEGAIDTVDSEVRNITSDHIIGKIRLSDEGTRSSFNSLTVGYSDPANKFESRNISFFNSDYLKADRNVPKKGNLTIPGITNYYNTRILANKYLNKSRFGLTISFNMAPRGLLLLAGTVFQLQYPRYGWTDKKFRITDITNREDTSVDIVAEEYDDSFYNLSKISKQAGSGAVGLAQVSGLGPPSNLKTTSIDTGDEAYSGVQITWTNNPDANTTNVYTEIYSSFSSKLYLTIDSITSNTITTSVPHELIVGEQIMALVTMNGLQQGKSYFVKTVTSSTQFTVSETKGGSVVGLVNGTALDAFIQTALLVDTVPVPTNSYTDVFSGIDSRVVKYYWIRHKVIS